ncbi:MAG: TAXI family TRAP transporter solute-binding subunit, partial [Cyanobacteriota bacterium]|nr:TAXI family TRAP transporter solute-binding subunit [Cyanobacteriota bacterium]
LQLNSDQRAEVVNAADSSLEVKAIATRGSTENISRLETGEIDIGLVEGNAAHQVLSNPEKSPTHLKVLFVMYPNPGMFVVQADSPDLRIADLTGKPIAFGTRNSGLRILATHVLDGIGFNPEQDFTPVILEKAADGPRLVLSGEVAALWGAGIGWPGFVKVANEPGGARFIAPSSTEIQQILTKYPHLKTMSVPANTYKGQDQAIDSVGLWSLILARPDLPDSIAYRLVGAIHQGQAALAERLAQGQYTTLKNTVENVYPENLHPGASRYFRESASGLPASKISD